jgi:hypothetical protein
VTAACLVCARSRCSRRERVLAHSVCVFFGFTGTCRTRGSPCCARLATSRNFWSTSLLRQGAPEVQVSNAVEHEFVVFFEEQVIPAA